MKGANAHTITKAMEHTDFYNWLDGHSVQRTNNLKLNDPKPLLGNMVQIIAKRGSMTLTYKTFFDGDSYKLDFLSVKGAKSISRKPDALEKPCGIDKDVKY